MIETVPSPDATSSRFPVGSTVVRRDLFRDQVWSLAAMRVVADDGNELVLACWPGSELLAPRTWTEWLTTGDDAVRKQALPDLARGVWELSEWTWRDTILLTQARHEVIAVK